MISVRLTANRPARTVKWFATSPVFSDAWRTVEYVQCQSKGKHFGFKRIPFFTVLIDLSASNDTLINNFKKNTRNEVRRAETEGVTASTEKDYQRFLEFQRTFATSRSLALPLAEDLIALGASLVITRAALEEETLVMHAYVVDGDIGRARLLYSSTTVRDAISKERRGTIGRANRYLHYEDMLLFKDQGLLVYDLGGIAKAKDGEPLAGIDKFKAGFGGEIIEDSNFVPHFLRLLKALKSACRRDPSGAR